MSVRVERNRFPELAARLGGAEQLLEDTAQDLRSAIAAGAPYAHLANGITVRKRGRYAREIRGPWDWLFPEYGTVDQAAHPFVEPALLDAEAALRVGLAGLLR